MPLQALLGAQALLAPRCPVVTQQSSPGETGTITKGDLKCLRDQSKSAMVAWSQRASDCAGGTSTGSGLYSAIPTGQESPRLSAPEEAQQGQLLFRAAPGTVQHQQAGVGADWLEEERGVPHGWPLPGGRGILLNHSLSLLSRGSGKGPTFNGTSRWFCPLGFKNST